MEKCGRAREVADDIIIRRMRIAYCISEATDTKSEYVISLRIPFPLERW